MGLDALDMGLDDTDDGLSAELGALVAKVANGFNADDIPSGTATAAPRMNGGGVQPEATPTEPDPGPPYDDTITADVTFDFDAAGETPLESSLENAEAFPTPDLTLLHEDADENSAPAEEDESEWVFVEIDGDEDSSAARPAEPPKANENSFRAYPKDSAVAFEVDTAHAPEANRDMERAAAAPVEDTTAETGTIDVPMSLSDLIEPKASPNAGSASDRGAAAIPLDIDVEPSDPDSADVLSVDIAGLPEGCTLSAGRAEPDGRWHLDAEDLPGLQVLLPEGYSKSFEVEITATETDPATGESSSVSDVMTVDAGSVGEDESSEQPQDVGPAAPEAEYLFPEDAAGTAHAAAGPDADPQVGDLPQMDAGMGADLDTGPGPIAFALDGALMDTDGSERLTLLVTGLPEGATLTGGKRGPKGTWLLTPNDVEELGIEVLPEFDYEFVMRVQVIATERGDPRVSTVLADMHVRVEPVGKAWRVTSVNSRTDDGNVTFEPGVPGRVTVTSEVTGTGANSACFLSLPQGYRVSWISPGVEADDRWSPGADGTGGVLDLTDFVTADGRLHWTFGIEASMRAEPAASADFPVTVERPDADDADFEVTDLDAKDFDSNGFDAPEFDGGQDNAPAAVHEVLRGGGGEDRRSGEAGPTRPAGAASPAAPEPEMDTPAADSADVTAELALSRGTVLDSDADSVTLSADAVGAIRLRDGVLKIKGVRAIEW